MNLLWTTNTNKHNTEPSPISGRRSSASFSSSSNHNHAHQPPSTPSSPHAAHNRATSKHRPLGRPAKHKVRHRKVRAGVTIFKGHPSYNIMLNLRLGIAYTVGRLGGNDSGPLESSAFSQSYKQEFPTEGSTLTPGHTSTPFRIKDHAPLVFRHLRQHFGIQEDEYQLALCIHPLRELGTPGKSGAVFYLTEDSRFILKTISKKESKFLRRMLPNYYAHIMSSHTTLLPHFFGLIRITTAKGRNIRMVVMNNLIPEDAMIHEKYDLKGSTLGRYATAAEKKNPNVTLKDLDFTHRLEMGAGYEEFCQQILCDCQLLRDLRIMDYSLLALLHFPGRADDDDDDPFSGSLSGSLLDEETWGRGENCSSPRYRHSVPSPPSLSKSRYKGSRANHSTMDGGDSDDDDDDLGLPVVPDEQLKTVYRRSIAIRMRNPTEQQPGYWRANVADGGEEVVLYCGIIDILQQYGTRKQLEHTYKAIRYAKQRAGISVTDPITYQSRFSKFILSLFQKSEETSDPVASLERQLAAASVSGEPRPPANGFASFLDNMLRNPICMQWVPSAAAFH